ncbi:MAG: dethiobiotin synthase [Rhodocyclales bacterium]|nr:dethiobiotin synthase [Rhodocyclales bacterium]
MHRQQAYFVTGTDTEVGKTFATCALLHAARRQGLQALGMKPVAAGVDGNGRNEDVEQLIAASSIAAPRELVNPYCFEAPVAPHIAAAVAGCRIDLNRIAAAARDLAANADLLLIEGVGGFRVPLGDEVDTADLTVRLNLPVILVVGLRLGCLNHALLTAEAIRSRGLELAGWIANGIDPDMPWPEENITALKERLTAPLLGYLPWLDNGDPATAAARLVLP